MSRVEALASEDVRMSRVEALANWPHAAEYLQEASDEVQVCDAAELEARFLVRFPLQRTRELWADVCVPSVVAEGPGSLGTPSHCPPVAARKSRCGSAYDSCRPRDHGASQRAQLCGAGIHDSMGVACTFGALSGVAGGAPPLRCDVGRALHLIIRRMSAHIECCFWAAS